MEHFESTGQLQVDFLMSSVTHFAVSNPSVNKNRAKQTTATMTMITAVLIDELDESGFLGICSYELQMLVHLEELQT